MFQYFAICAATLSDLGKRAQQCQRAGRSQPSLLRAAPGRERPRRCHGRASLRRRHCQPGSAGGSGSATAHGSSGTAASASSQICGLAPRSGRTLLPQPEQHPHAPNSAEGMRSGTARPRLWAATAPPLTPARPFPPSGPAARPPRCHGGSRPQGGALSPAMRPGTLWRSGRRGPGPAANWAIRPIS